MIKTITSYLECATANGFIISNGRTSNEVVNDLCTIIKGVFFDWSSKDGNYDINKYMNELLKRCIKGTPKMNLLILAVPLFYLTTTFLTLQSLL
ncbi:MAG: hypothetical protein Q4G58_04720 [bacterium]|nr:hypothetical protein [bacterium]